MMYNVGMYIARIPNRGSPPTILLRESYRQGGQVKTRTLANLSKLPPAALAGLRRLLRGETLVPVEEAFQVVASWARSSRADGHATTELCQPDRLTALAPDAGDGCFAPLDGQASWPPHAGGS